MMTAGARRRFGADFAIRSQIRQTHAVATCLDRTTTARFCRSKPIRPDALWLLTGLDQRGRRSIFAVRSQDPGGASAGRKAGPILPFEPNWGESTAETRLAGLDQPRRNSHSTIRAAR